MIMFTKILIANRGEIACRVIHTAREMGVATVAVYSEPDENALHVEMADEAVSLGGVTAAESYLRIDAIVAACKATGAEAVHPGYGFLSENPEFVVALEAARITFIGPSAEAIRAMGLKDAAKALMEQADVPVVPGYHGADQDDALLANEAGKIGYPVLIKAVAGGGGKGMRLVENAGAFDDALAAARGEAKGAFGNGAVLIEKFVTSPRHIEVQVFGDGERAIHLYERDCSLQRRHQKVIEEAPAPGMTEDMRAAMGRAAVRAAEAIRYKGAGTVEFIVDSSDGLRPDGFWFMEMNTRLQVEHPVTEAVTGIDLVEWQLRVAAGESLPLVQADIPLKGHAFEARLYAENVPAGFLPATGTLTHLKFPEDCRADTGVRAGDVISPYYDPMIAKVICHGADRDAALRGLSRALRKTEIAGTVTNLAFLGALAAHDGFVAGEVDTGLIERDIDALLPDAKPRAEIAAQAALVAAELDGPPGWDQGFSIWGAPWQDLVLAHHDAEIAVRIKARAPGTFLVDVGGAVVEAQWVQGRWRFDGAPGAAVTRAGGHMTVLADYGQSFEIIDPLDRAASATGDGNTVDAPMPGLVKGVFVAKGQGVAQGDRLAVLEAMKMEHTLVAARDGVVEEVLTAEGVQVEAGAVLIRLEEEA